MRKQLNAVCFLLQPASGAVSPLPAEPIRQRLTMSSSEGFSSAASTRSLSFSCLLTAASVEWDPGDSCATHTRRNTQ